MLPLLIVFMERRFTKPVEVLVNDQRTFVPRVRRGVEKGATRADIDVSEEGIRPRYELRELYDSTNQMRRDTVEFAKELHTRSVERERVATELNIAQQIQLGSVPHDFTAFRWKFGLDIGSVIRPAKQVGGDFYDVFNVGAHDIAFIIGDVSGKGIPAALFMMRAQTLIRQQLSECADLGTAITLVNRKLCERNESLLFVTAFVCVLNTTTGEVRYVNAGHNPPVLNEHGRSSFLSCKPGLVLGAMNAVTYRQGTFNLHAGDGLVLYTDGVTEACDPDNNLFGDGRLLDTLNGSNMVDIQGRLNDVVKTVDAFSGTAPQADDITMLAFRWPVQVHHVELMPEEENLERLFAFLEPLCDRDGCTPRMMNGLMLVCEELFVNICRYGFPKEQKMPVIFECIMDDSQGRLQLTITDSGVAYNPLDYESEKIVSGKDHRIGGMGILLVGNNVDEINYEHIDGENILHISKRYV
jgi:serine phosphatase RsbU (regulator of sigma subunit)/anti-sigma regulatory factor (Ser/Thr protein kinase)